MKTMKVLGVSVLVFSLGATASTLWASGRKKPENAAAENHEHAGQAHGDEHAGQEHAGSEHAGNEHAGSEHAGKEHAGQEHAGQEHAGKSAAAATTITAQDVKDAIHAHLDQETAQNDGHFVIEDEKLDKTWMLDFVKIHDPVRIINDKTYFACMDFKEVGGDQVLDLDFWLEATGQESPKLKVTDVKIHKLDGEPRFTYQNDKPVEVK